MITTLFRITSVAVATLTLATVTARSAAIDVFVEVKGYQQWPMVINSSNLGGRVIFSPAHGRYITDRVARGERFSVSFRLERGEKSLGDGIAGYSGLNSVGVDGAGSQFAYLNARFLRFPLEVFGTMPQIATNQKVEATAFTGNSLPTVRSIPLGSRGR